MALVILAHYEVVFHGLRQDWFIQDLGARVVEVVRSRLDDEWRPMVFWPTQQVGLRGESSEKNETA